MIIGNWMIREGPTTCEILRIEQSGRQASVAIDYGSGAYLQGGKAAKFKGRLQVALRQEGRERIRAVNELCEQSEQDYEKELLDLLDNQVL